MAAVSTRRMFAPSVTNLPPRAHNNSSSLSVSPPSGPITAIIACLESMLRNSGLLSQPGCATTTVASAGRPTTASHNEPLSDISIRHPRSHCLHASSDRRRCLSKTCSPTRATDRANSASTRRATPSSVHFSTSQSRRGPFGGATISVSGLSGGATRSIRSIRITARETDFLPPLDCVAWRVQAATCPHKSTTIARSPDRMRSTVSACRDSSSSRTTVAVPASHGAATKRGKSSRSRLLAIAASYDAAIRSVTPSAAVDCI